MTRDDGTTIGRLARDGLRVGVVAAAATAGALVGFGLARGTPWRPVNAVAHIAVGPRAFGVDRFDATVTLLGLGVHVASVLVWGVLFAALAGRLRGTRLAAAALLFVAAAWVVDLYLVPHRLRPGFETVLTGAELAATYLVLAAALAVGVTLRRRAVLPP